MIRRALPSLPVSRYLARRREFDMAMKEVLRSGQFILSRQTAAFEKEFAAFLGARHCVGVASGTDALELCLRACDIGKGDAVLTVAHTAAATIAAIERAGAVPVLVDIDAASFTMAPESLQDTIAEYDKRARAANRPKLKAVIPVHLYGHPADMPATLSIARKRGLVVIEDCAQSHGASLSGKQTGTWGDLAAFSFYPTKNLGAFGDGGAVVTKNARLAGKLKLLREYGWETRFISALPGVNSRLDELQSAMLRVSLKYLNEENEARRVCARQYERLLEGTGITLPRPQPHVVHAFHQYVIQTKARDALQRSLATSGIHTQIHYPVPIHRQPAYRGRFFAGRFGLPNTEQAAKRVLSLPMSPFLAPRDIEAICRIVRRALGKSL